MGTVHARDLEKESASHESFSDITNADGVTAAYEAKSRLINEHLQNELGCRQSVHLSSTPPHPLKIPIDIWLQGVAIILPQIQLELHPSRVEFATLSLYVGLILGASTWGILADLIGRRLSFNITLFIAGVFGIAAGGSNNFTTLGALIACMWLLTLLSAWWALGQLFASLIAWPLIGNFSCTSADDCPKSSNMGWRYTLGGVTLLMWVCRYIVFDLQESPKYLIGKGRDEEAIEVLQRIARKNGKQLTLTVEKLRAVSGGQEVESTPLTTVQLIKESFSSISRLIGLAYPLFNGFITLYLTTQECQWRLGIPGSIIACLVVDYTRKNKSSFAMGGRKLTMAISTALTGIFFFLFTTSTTEAAVLGFSSYQRNSFRKMYGVLYAYTPEVFPAPHRGTGDALCSSFNRITGILAPVIKIATTTAAGTATNGTANGPIFIAASLFIVSAILMLFLPIESHSKNMFETNSLRLRAVRETDFAKMLELWNDYRVQHTLSTEYVVPRGVKFEETLRGWAASSIFYVIIETKNGGDWVGSINLFNEKHRDRQATLGMALLPEFWGRGYATEALSFFIDHTFRELGLHRVALEVLETNVAARKVYKKGVSRGGGPPEMLLGVGGMAGWNLDGDIEWLLYVELSPENLYFILWLREYSFRYRRWAEELKSLREEARGLGLDWHSNTSSQLAMFYARAKQTFFTPNSHYELNLPSDMLAPFHVTNSSPHPDPAIFDQVAIETRKMLKESLQRFVSAQYNNVGNNRVLCGIIAGSVFSFIGGIFPIMYNLVMGHSRWTRLSALPGLWLGLAILFASLHGVCLGVYIFGDLRQLRKFELTRPPISKPQAFYTRTLHAISSPITGLRVSPGPILPTNHSTDSFDLRPPPPVHLQRARVSSIPSSYTSSSDLSCSESDGMIHISPAYYEVDPIEGPAISQPAAGHGAYAFHMKQKPDAEGVGGGFPFGATAAFIHPFDHMVNGKYDFDDPNKPTAVERQRLSSFDFDALPPPPVARVRPAQSQSHAPPYLSSPPPSTNSLPLGPNILVIQPDAEPVEKDLTPKGFLRRIQSRCNINRWLVMSGSQSSINLSEKGPGELGKFECEESNFPRPHPSLQRNPQAEIFRRQFKMVKAVPAFASPLTHILSPIVIRGQWEIVIRSMIIACFVSWLTIGVLLAVPVPKRH
ncbi:hypothetical protein D9757_003521 [Collybiopsis confluens]|uniref:N-acetyltransferase domain-containing protein n=1 Tax=Collybiopsis confluens TaxID=2823264 RepID=A0A8H5HTG7_9AGAR|nr:hypothetical protein D9757_003521 [Collybiopsis confluens]